MAPIATNKQCLVVYCNTPLSQHHGCYHVMTIPSGEDLDAYRLDSKDGSVLCRDPARTISVALLDVSTCCRRKSPTWKVPGLA